MAEKKGTRNMTIGNPKWRIISFAVPVFFSQLFQTLYNSVDSMIVGKYLGKEALAAVSSAGNLIFLITSFFTGTAMGAGVIISRYFGAKEYDRMSKAIHTNVAFGLVAGVLLAFFRIYSTLTILKWMNTDPTVLPDSITYFRCYFIGAIAIVMYNIFTGIMNAVGDSRSPLIFLIVSSVINVILDYLLVGVMGYGAYIKIEGFGFLPITCFTMAMATFVSQNLGAGLHDRVKKGARFGITASIILAELVGIVIFIFIPIFMHAFSDEAYVITYGVTQARTEKLFYLFLAYAHCIAGVCRGAGKAVAPMVIMLSVWCVLRITYITIAMNVCHDIRLIYLAYPITWFISSVIFFVYYIKSDWIHGFDKKKVRNV